ncbi:MAG: TetR/AcrR family transcriptional regulator [Candidatus Tectomicrobia bacterium]
MTKAKKTPPPKEQEIITAAAQLFKEKGYRATTLEDIAAAVGMLKGSLYYYIRSKEELLYLVVRDPIRQAYNKLEEIVKSEAPATTKIAQAIANHMTLFHQHYPHIAVYLHDFHNLKQKLQDNAIETPKHYQRLWTVLLQQGVETGELRPDLDVKVTGYAILGMSNWVYRWYNPQGALSAEEIADVFTKLALEGLTQRKHSAEV